MWPSFNRCFPDPLSAQWPSTQYPVLCECRQLYVLVSICCCIPSTHLLVLHDGIENSIFTSIPNGPTCLELRINEHTTCEALCGFLLRAQSASRASVSSNFVKFHHQQVTVVCLLGLDSASPSVMSALMDVLVFGLVRLGNTTRSVPSLRIVAFCNSRMYASVLPEHVRSAFLLSTYMSSLSMESPAVIQSTDRLTSSVVNRRNMLSVMHSHDSKALIDTVTLSGEVSHYLRHLLIVVRGSMVQHSVPGSCIPSRLPRMLNILKVAALLFAPSVRPASGIQSLFSMDLAASSQQQCAFSEAHITSFSHVVVSPAHVICFLCPMVAHLFTIHRAMVALTRGNTTKGGKGAGMRPQHFPEKTGKEIMSTAKAKAEGPSVTEEEQTTGERGCVVVCKSVEYWEARVVGWISQSGASGDATHPNDETVIAGPSTVRELTRFIRDPMDGLLSYLECRELMRATVLQRSAPSSG